MADYVTVTALDLYRLCVNLFGDVFILPVNNSILEYSFFFGDFGHHGNRCRWRIVA